MTGRGDLWRALGAWCEEPGPAHERLSDALGLPGALDTGAHTEVFLMQVYPYASVYLGAEGMLGGDARDRIAGFWRALSLVPPAEPDHLASLLGLVGTLTDLEGNERDPALALARRHARRALLWEHVLPWTGVFVDAVGALGVAPADAWASLLEASLVDEIADLGAQDRLSAHLCEAPVDLATPDAGLRELIAGVLAPARSGMVLTRSDLARLAGAAGTGLRSGERAFILRAIAEQEPAATLGWLADEAGRWESRHQGRMHGDLLTVARFWRDRAAGAPPPDSRSTRGRRRR